MCLARAALDAGDYTLARKAAMASVEAEPRESGYLLLADIEEEDTGEAGKVRQWLARAIRAPRDPAWTADGFVSRTWAPISPVTGRLDAFQWKVPIEHVEGDHHGPLIDITDDAENPATTIENMTTPKPSSLVPEDSSAAAGADPDKPAPDVIDPVGNNRQDGVNGATRAPDDQGSEPAARFPLEKDVKTPEAARPANPVGPPVAGSKEAGFGPSSEDRKEARFG